MGDWVVTPRRGKAVEINALWYNALRLLANWLREIEDERQHNVTTSMPNARAISFNQSVSGSRTAVIFTMSSIATASRELTIRRAGRIKSSPSRSIIRFSIRNAWQSVLDVARKEIADAGWTAFAFARRSGIQTNLLRRSSLARWRLSSGNGLGLVDRTVRRCLAESSSGRSRQARVNFSKLFRSI